MPFRPFTLAASPCTLLATTTNAADAVARARDRSGTVLIVAMLKLVAGVLAGATLVSTAHAAEVRLGQVGLSFYAVKGEVARAVLEENGHTVETIEGSHADIYPRLGAGEVDLLAASWLPNGHADLFAEVESSVERLTPLYDDARFFWVVPDYVPEDQVSAIADLADPAVAERMNKTIATLAPSTGLTIGAERMMEEYGLDDAGYELVPGSAEDWVASLRTATQNEEWVVLPLWQPQWLNADFAVRRLDDTRNVYGADDTTWLVAHEDLSEKLDEQTLQHLSNIRLPITAVTEMDRLVNVEGLTPREAAARWMADNADFVAGWRPSD